MEDSEKNKSLTLLIEVVDKLVRLYLAYLTKTNLNKAKLSLAKVLRLAILAFFILILSISSWWGLLAIVFVSLKLIGIQLIINLAILLVLNLIALIISARIVRHLVKHLDF